MKEAQRVAEVSVSKAQEIRESYSGDTIASQKTIRGPFQFEGRTYVSVGWIQTGEECYRVVPRDQCDDDVAWYGEELTWDVTLTESEKRYGGWGAYRRSQPEGFYHRMLVKRGKSEWVMLGPPVLFVSREENKELVKTEQLALL